MDPSIEFSSSTSLLKLLNNPMESGVEPVKRFPDRSSDVRHDRLPRADGIMPLILLLRIDNLTKDFQLSSTVPGIVPERELPSVEKTLRSVREPMVEGMDPLS